MEEIEKLVLKYLERKKDLKPWFYGSKMLTREETIELFKKDKNFRAVVVQAVISVATDLLSGE
ncbi:MAG: hypothetical protein QXT14_08820 [Candidatus Bathyarchaeia archaeon]